jgi:signal transduction histidine kinase
MRLGLHAAGLIARLPARVQTKLLVAFLAMVALLVLLGAVGLQVLSGVNQQTEDLIRLQRKIAAYRQVQHDTTAQLYGVASALLSPNERVLEAVLRQLTQFGYDLDRLEFVAQGEVELLGEVRQEYERLIGIVTRAVELAGTQRVAEAQEIQLRQAGPLADRLERLTNQLVNLAEADMVAGIEASQRAYDTSRTVVIAFALGSIVLALGLGYAISWSIVGPVTEIKTRLGQIATGDFTQRVPIANRDELGALATGVNSMCEDLGRLYEQREALAAVGQVVNASLDLKTVLRSILEHACALAAAEGGTVHVLDEASGRLELAAAHQIADELVEHVRDLPAYDEGTILGRCMARRETVQKEDVALDGGYALRETVLRAGFRSLLALPLLREGRIIGGLIVCRGQPGVFPPETVELLQSFAAQSALAIHNARLYHELEQKSRQLELASRHKSQFLANMSHELRTPLNAILGFAELVQDGIYGEVPARVRGVLERIQAGGKHLLGLINDVLDLSKIEAGQLKLSLADYTLQDVVGTVASSTEALANAKGLAFRVELPAAGLPRGRGDAQRLRQVLLNLVGNAIKFTDTGEVAIRAVAVDSEFQVVVADTGPGIPEAEQRRIFEEFHQVDSSSTREKGGTGLGLAISRRIIELHGGRIWVESEPGRGSRFCFAVPVRLAEEALAV